MGTEPDLIADRFVGHRGHMTTTTALRPTSPATRPRLLTAAVVRLLLADLAAMTSFYLLLPVVPLYSAERGLGAVGAGLSTAVLMFASVGTELITPRLAGRIGYPRLLAIGLVLLGAPALAVPALSDLGPLMAVCVLRGIGFAIVVVAVGALAAAALPEERRGEGLGLFGVVASLPAVAGLPMGVWLVPAAGFPVVFAVGALVSLVAVGTVVGLPAGTAAGSGSRTGLRTPALIGPAALFGATAIAAGVLVTFLPDAVGGASLAATALLVQSAAATATRWWAGRHADRHGPDRLLVPALVVAAVGMAAVAVTGSALAVLVGALVFGAGFGAAQSASLNLMLARVSRAEYGAVSAAWNAAYDLGWGLGAAGAGAVVGIAGYPVAFGLAAGLVVVAVPVVRLLGRQPIR
jgi:MFS family permease